MLTAFRAAVITALIAITHSAIAADEGRGNGVSAVDASTSPNANSTAKDYTVKTYTVTPTQPEPKVGPEIIEPLPPEGDKVGANSK